MNIFHSFVEGGVFMYFILLFGVFTVGFIAERMTALYLNRSKLPVGFRQQVTSYIKRGDLAGGIEFLKALPAQSVTRILTEALELRSKAGAEEELQSRMDEALTHEIAKIDKRTGFLAMFGNVATLLGLLGTITGMIHSFGAVTNANPADRALLLSKGISEAMNCTAFGLIVAIPALVSYAIFQSKTDKIIADLTETVAKLYHDLIYLYEPGRVK